MTNISRHSSHTTECRDMFVIFYLLPVPEMKRSQKSATCDILAQLPCWASIHNHIGFLTPKPLSLFICGHHVAPLTQTSVVHASSIHILSTCDVPDAQSTRVVSPDIDLHRLCSASASSRMAPSDRTPALAPLSDLQRQKDRWWPRAAHRERAGRANNHRHTRRHRCGRALPRR